MDVWMWATAASSAVAVIEMIFLVGTLRALGELNERNASLNELPIGDGAVALDASDDVPPCVGPA